MAYSPDRTGKNGTLRSNHTRFLNLVRIYLFVHHLETSTASTETITMPAQSPAKALPPLPPIPDGCQLTWVGEYVWSDPPRQEAWAGDKHGLAWVCVWNEKKATWGEWFKNDASA